MSFRPSLLCTVAPTGHTGSHGAVSQCIHGTGWKYVLGFSTSPWWYVSTRSQCISRPRMHFGLADDRNVVFGLARHDARVAAIARVDVDRHAPLVTAAFACSAVRMGHSEMHLVLIFLEGGELGSRHGANEIAAFHQMVILHAGEREGVARQRNLSACRERQCV